MAQLPLGRRNPRFPPGQFELQPGILNLDQLNDRYVCLIRHGQKIAQVVVCPTQLSPSKKSIQFGGFHSDAVRGWYEVSSVEIVEVLKLVPVTLESRPDGSVVQTDYPRTSTWEYLGGPFCITMVTVAVLVLAGLAVGFVLHYPK